MNASACSIFGFRKSPSLVDFPDHMSAVFFISGCNFCCGFCHNASLMQVRQQGYTWDRFRDVCARFRDQWVDGAVLTGGEPTLAPDLIEVVTTLREYGFAVKLDTNGSKPDVLAEVLPLVRYVAMDVKCALASYPGFVHFPDTACIRESVQLLRADTTDYELRTTVVESFHTDDEMRAIGELIAPARRYVLQPFVPRDDVPDPDLASQPRTNPERLEFLGRMMEAYAEEVIVRGM